MRPGQHRGQGQRRGGSRGGSGAGVTFPGEIAAVVESDNTTGTSLVNIFLPLRPGDATAQMVTDRQITVEVNGVEQAVFLKAARGRFADGYRGAVGETLRAVHGHFTYNIPSVNTPISAKFILGRTRSTVDLSETTITDTHITARRCMMPSQPAHLCDTWLTWEPLVPQLNLNAQNTAYFKTKWESVYNSMKNNELTEAFGGPATYEQNAALLAQWCMTGTTEYFWQAWRRNRAFMGYNLPENGTGFWTPEINPSGWVTGLTSHGGTPGEAHSQRYRSYSAQYMATGAIEYWNVVCGEHAAQNFASTSEAAADDLNDNNQISGNWGPRWNIRGFMPKIAAVILDATKSFSNSGGWTGRAWGGANAATEFPWHLNAFEVHKFNKLDHRDNQRGCYDEATDGGARPGGDFPFFQFALTTDAFLRYFLNVKEDATVATWIKNNVDVMLNCITPARGEANAIIDIGCAIGGTQITNTGAPTGGRNYFIIGETIKLSFNHADVEDKIVTNITNGGLTLHFSATARAHPAGRSVWGVEGTDGYNEGTQWGYTYMNSATANIPSTHIADDPWTLPMWAAPIKFCEKYFGNNTVNGATYSTWYSRVIDPLQLVSLFPGSNWKQIGESWGYNMLAPYLDQIGIPTGLPSSIRSPTQY